MALQGSLADFGFVEVLQLIASQEKTGTLRLNSERGRDVLVFDGGEIISAWDPRATSRDPFREFLIRREVVPRDHLPRVQKAEISSPHSFAEILLRMRILGHTELQEAFADHVQEKVDELLQWKQGFFEFLPQESVVRYSAGVGLKTEGLLMEAVRRLDEGGATRIRPDTVLVRERRSAARAQRSRSDRGRATDADDGGGETAEAPMLSPAAETLLALVDGKRSFGLLQRISGIDRSEAIVAAEELLENRCVAIVGTGTALEPASEPVAPPASVLVHATILAVLVTFSLIGHRWIAARPPAGHDDPVAELVTSIGQIEEERRLIALRAALDYSRGQHGRYPDRLDALLLDGLVTMADLESFRGQHIVYYPLDDGRGYRVEPGESSSVVRRPKP